MMQRGSQRTVREEIPHGASWRISVENRLSEAMSQLEQFSQIVDGCCRVVQHHNENIRELYALVQTAAPEGSWRAPASPP